MEFSACNRQAFLKIPEVARHRNPRAAFQDDHVFAGGNCLDLTYAGQADDCPAANAKKHPGVDLIFNRGDGFAEHVITAIRVGNEIVRRSFEPLHLFDCEDGVALVVADKITGHDAGVG